MFCDGRGLMRASVVRGDAHGFRLAERGAATGL